MTKFKFFVVLFSFLQIHCSNSSQNATTTSPESPQDVITKQLEESPSKELLVGAARVQAYLPLLKGKKIALLVNQTSMIGNTHLVDTLVRLGIQIERIFAPEHGFRGKADAGEQIKDSKDTKTGIPLISLYGKKKKPSKKDLAGLDMVVFDIQDVGARFYTYISSMHYVMEACAENGVSFLVLDRPNPNGHYVDGPILKESHRSFVGMHPVPIVHGMTVAEYARMINGEGWLKNGLQCDLKYISCANYDHQTFYELPIKPSPNLPNIRSILLYPSLCFFEGTVASVGRGTNTQFQVYGHPDFKKGNYQFTPQSMEGAKSPKHQGKLCKGFNLSDLHPSKLHQQKQLNLSYLIDFYQNFERKSDFFLSNLFFDKLAGGTNLRVHILAGKTEEEIRESWKKGLQDFQKIRKKYLIYD